MTKQANPYLLDAKLCTRCSGTGSYSYNAMHGSRCYGCNGSGWKLTKRGAAAQQWLNDQRMVRYADLKPGDTVLAQGFTAGSFTVGSEWVRVMYVETKCAMTGNYPTMRSVELQYVIHGRPVLKDGSLSDESFDLGGFANSTIRRRMTREQVAALRHAAIEYQSTLNGHGKPAKRVRACANCGGAGYTIDAPRCPACKGSSVETGAVAA
jgi:hypothetical protein